jgi:hypothetical protein
MSGLGYIYIRNIEGSRCKEMSVEDEGKDFCTLYMKYCLKRVSFSSGEKILLEIYEISRRITSVTLLAAFEDWMKRLI